MIRKIILFLGLALCFYPYIATGISKYKQTNITELYEAYAERITEQECEKEIEEAKLYNTKLVEGICPKNYKECLKLEKEGVMGILRIPSIDICLPIYHGTSKSVLQKGVGHIQKSSLPIGGNNTHCLLAGHRGLPDAELFTDLVKLEIGQKIYMDVLNKTYEYEIFEIQTIRPEETETLQIQKGKDLLSLITCTPYGINTHRFVVTGERVNEK